VLIADKTLGLKTSRVRSGVPVTVYDDGRMREYKKPGKRRDVLEGWRSSRTRWLRYVSNWRRMARSRERPPFQLNVRDDQPTRVDFSTYYYHKQKRERQPS
jgi:hypothetical protein